MKSSELKQLSEKPAQRLSEASEQREACQDCTLFKTCQTPFMKPWVPKGWTGKRLGVGEAPGQHEDEVSFRPFTGAAGKLLTSLWREAGYEDRDFALVNTVRCRPVKNAKPSMVQIRACRPFLLRVIQELKPEQIITFGGTALKAITNDGHMENVTENRGRQVTVKDMPPIWATYHPASVLHGNLHHKDRILEDLKRSTWPVVKWPKDDMPSGKFLGLDTEFIEDPYTVLAIGVATDKAATASATYLLRALKQADKLALHNGGCDIDALIQKGCCKETWAKGIDIRDSLWLARLSDENRGKGGYKLENLFLSIWNTKPWKPKTDAYGPDPRKWPLPLMLERCRLDAWAAYKLSQHFIESKSARGKLQIQHRIGMTLQRIYHAGAYIDLGFLEKFAKTTEQTLAEVGTKLKRAAKRLGLKDFDPGNKNHIRQMVYEGLGITPEYFTAKGTPSVGKLYLKQLAGEHKEIQLALDYSKAAKIQQTYIESIRKMLRPAHSPCVNGRTVAWMPVRINPLGARTLRRSSGRDPFDDAEENGLNFQNWTKDVRPLITTRFKGGMITDQDFHKLEAILQGWLADEQKMVDYFLYEENGYIKIGQDLFGKTVQEDTPDYRTIKSIVLGVNYNMKPFKLAQELKLKAGVMLHPRWERHLELTEGLYRRYMQLFPRLRQYIEACADEALSTGKIVMSLGYERRLPLPPEPPRSERDAWRLWNKQVNHVKNEAANCRAQHLASLVTGTAMLDVEERLLSKYHLTYVDYYRMLMEKKWPLMPILINEVHDDLVFDVPKDRMKENMKLIHETMEELPTLRRLMPELPDIIRADQKAAPSWGAK